MSTTNDIKNLLDIQDPNIIFKENCVKKGRYKEKDCKYVDGILTYHAAYCARVGQLKIILSPIIV